MAVPGFAPAHAGNRGFGVPGAPRVAAGTLHGRDERTLSKTQIARKSPSGVPPAATGSVHR